MYYTEVFSKILAKKKRKKISAIHKRIIIHHDLVRFSSWVQGLFNIQKSIHVIHNNELKKKIRLFQSIKKNNLAKFRIQFPDDNDIEDHFICLFAICIISLVSWVFRSFNWVIFLLLSCKRSLCNLDTIPLSDRRFANIFSWSMILVIAFSWCGLWRSRQF